ncbi:MAG: hypothetical protein AAGH72_03585 [Verrucomicrobiota bacterium]
MSLRKNTAILFLSLLGCVSAHAEKAVLFPFSQSDEPDLSKLGNGKVHGNRLKTGGSQLSMGVETYFLVPLPPENTLKKLKTITPPSSGATNSFGIQNKARIQNPARTSDFSRFRLTGSNGQFGFGGSDMLNLKTRHLNLSHTEMAQLKKAKSGGTSRLEAAWKQVFAARAQDFQNGGYQSFARYDTTAKPFHHRAELVTLLLSTPKVLKNFQALIGGVMTGKLPEGAHTPVYSWESSKVQGEQTISLMCLISSPHENGRIQIVETSFYVTGNYFTSMILYELTPVYDDQTGKEQTLVWRGDFVITESIGFLRGIERIAAENIMMLEVVSSVEGFVKSVSK